MLDPGRIAVRLLWDARVAGAEVEIRSLDPGRVVLDLQPEQAVAVVARLYAICGEAQRIAAQSALEAARGEHPAAALTQQRSLCIRAEAGREHLWRLLIDWPKLLRQPSHESLYAVWHRHLSVRGGSLQPLRHDAALLLQKLIGTASSEWTSIRTSGELDDWFARQHGIAARLLAALAGEGSAPEPGPLDRQRFISLHSADICARPASAETGALARQHARPLVADVLRHRGAGAFARVLARVLETVDFLNRLESGGLGWLEADAHAPDHRSEGANGQGRAWVETARGVLLHEVDLKRGRVARYLVRAPTQINFSPGGICAQQLQHLTAHTTEEALAQAARTILGLDPCLPFEIELHHPGQVSG
jgi:uptake hydrogenase large subunit